MTSRDDVFMGGSLSQLSRHLDLWSSASEDIKCLIVNEGSCNFMSETSSLYVTTLPSLIVIGIAVVEMFLVCHVILQGNMIKESFDYMDRSPSCHKPAKFGGYRQ